MKAILRQPKILSGTYIFCPRLGTKKISCCIGSKMLSSKAIFTKFSAAISLEITVWRLYRGSPKFYQVRTFFDRDWGQKKHLAVLVLKRSVLKQSLSNFQLKLLWRSQYESYIEAAQNFFMYVTIFVTDWGQKNHLAKLVLKRSVLKQSLPNFQHQLL